MAKSLQCQFTLIFCLLSFLGFSQEYRTLDGTNNNLSNLTWGSSGENLLRLSGNGYGDLIAEPGGISRPNPRLISNEIFAQEGLIESRFKLSSLVWVFGQFLDHDFGLTSNHPTEEVNIRVPSGDPMMDPFGTGTVEIHVSRNVFDPATGTSVSNVRQHPNEITAYLDGSAIYGSDQHRGDWLRSFQDGKLKVSGNNLMPYNTLNGEFTDDIDPNAPHMGDDVGFFDKLFVAGDVRANENVSLAAVHTIFVREHNTICNELKAVHPDWTDEQLYQKARAINTGKVQSITYNEWLPAVGLDLDPYQGYNDKVNPQLTNVFTAAAFRMGHTLLNSEILRLDENGDVIPDGNLVLRNAFFNPPNFVKSGMDNLFRGMGALMQNEFDNKVVDDVRNFLFGAPGSGRGGLDLVSINIQRGRERGLSDFNTIREAFGLPKVTSFDQITENPELAAKMQELYGNVDNLDAWVGFLCETSLEHSIFGETLTVILKDQFERVRDGDRFFYLVDPVLTEEEKELVHNTRMIDIILRNTDIQMMQGNVFKMMTLDTLYACGPDAPLVDVQGRITNKKGIGVNEVNMELLGEHRMLPAHTNENGQFALNRLPTCYKYGIHPSKGGDQRDGLSTHDLLKVRFHLLEIAPFNSGHEYLAADVNEDDVISIVDALGMIRMILEKVDKFPTDRVWRFVPAEHVYDPADYFANLQDTFWVDKMKSNMSMGMTAIKIGDLDDNYQAQEVQTRTQKEPFVLNAKPIEQIGNAVTLRLSLENYNHQGFQFALGVNPELVSISDVQALNEYSETYFNVKDASNMTLIYDQTLKQKEFIDITLALKDAEIDVASALFINTSAISPEGYDYDLEVHPIELKVEQPVKGDNLGLYLAGANPFVDETRLMVVLPETAPAELAVYDMHGRMVSNVALDGVKGGQEVAIHSGNFPIAGNYIIQLNTEKGTKSILVSKL